MALFQLEGFVLGLHCKKYRYLLSKKSFPNCVEPGTDFVNLALLQTLAILQK